MTNKVKGSIAGVAASLLAVGLWLVLILGLEMMAGIAGALMGVLFLWAYRKFNPDDKSPYAIIFASVLIIAEIILSEFLVVLILTNRYSLDFGATVSFVSDEIIRDILVGLVLSFLCFIGYVVSIKKRSKPTKNRFSTSLDKQNIQDNIDTQSAVKDTQSDGQETLNSESDDNKAISMTK